MKKKYPAKLFWSGVLLNMIRKFVLLIAAVVLLVIGIWNTTCLYIGAVLLALSILSAIFEQLVYKRNVMTDDSAEFADIKDMILDDNWDDNMKELIRKSELSVKEISIILGFDTPNYFSKTFKKKTGLTPLEYRKEKTKKGF